MSVRKAIVLGLACVLCAVGTAWGTNSVTVPSVTVAPNQTDVVLPIRLANDEDIRGIDMPFLIRKLDDAYPSAVKLDYGDRLTTALSEIRFWNHYQQGAAEESGCKRIDIFGPYGPGGFVGSPDYNGTDKQAVPGTAIPYGIFFASHRILQPNLPAGVDATGSLIITLDIGPDEGTFEIDTACVDPYNHIIFRRQDNSGILPNFTKGVITVAAAGGNTPPVALDDDKGARDGVTLFVVGAGVLTNDSDADGDPLTAVLGADVSHGTLLLNADGSFFYTPANGFEGTDQFTYRAHDTFSYSPPATVTIHVKGGGAVSPGDYDEDGDLTAIDLGAEIDALFMGALDPCDGGCRDWPRGDLDCDGYSTVLDLSKLITHIFAGGPKPCNPCNLQ